MKTKKEGDLMVGLVNKKQPQVANFAGDKEIIIKQKYKLTSFNKGGAFGDVFFARHVEKGYDVAIKFVSTMTITEVARKWLLKRINSEMVSIE